MNSGLDSDYESEQDDDFAQNDYFVDKANEVEAALLARVPENKIRPRIEPTARLAQLLGDPQKAYRVIHVTGTNGKTSTSRFIERILRELGLRTGRFTSPHLIKLNERISIDGEPVSNERLVAIWVEIEPVVSLVDAELAERGEDPLTFFEVLAVLAFSIFADAPIDVLVLEVGMGGEWDSTNIADGDVAVFTPIDLDHMDRLGESVADIAKTKAGIIKPGAIVVSAKQQSDALAQLEARSKAVADKFFIYGKDFEVTNIENDLLGQNISVRSLAGEYYDLQMPVHGEYQAQNAVLALAAVEAFVGGGEQRLIDDVYRASFSDFSSPGRLQVISRDPLVILDAAHNVHGAAALALSIKDTFGSPYAVGVISVLSEKDARGLFEKLDGVFVEFVITQSNSPRAIDASMLAELATEVLGADRVRVQPKPALALAEAIVLLPEGQPGAVVVTGSVTLVGEILKQQQLDLDEDA